MARCAFIKAGGQRCEATAMKGYDHCYGHRPDLAEERRRNASKGGKRGGRGRPQAELRNTKTRLSDLADAVLDGTQDRADAAVAGQLLNTIIRAVGMELRVREQQDLIERLELLEEALEQKKGGYGYGA